MKMLHKAALASTFALSVLAFTATVSSSARADTSARSGGYCLQFGDNEVQCDFATLEQCHQSASGLNGECYMDYARREDSLATATHMHGQHR